MHTHTHTHTCVNLHSHTHRSGLPFAFHPDENAIYARGLGGPGDFDVIRLSIVDGVPTVSLSVLCLICKSCLPQRITKRTSCERGSHLCLACKPHRSQHSGRVSQLRNMSHIYVSTASADNASNQHSV